MLRFCIFVFCQFILFFVFAQQQTTLYLFPGQGSDYRIFDSLNLKSDCKQVIINYPLPKRQTTLRDYAEELSHQIDTTKPFVLVGVSLGGMICVEISEILKPQKVIIISSAQNRNDFPFRYKFQRVIPLYRLFPPIVLRGGAKIMQPLVEPDRKHYKATFKSMLKQKNAKYVKRTIHMIMTWNKEFNNTKIYQIHGTNDHTLPFRKIKNPDVKIQHGSHMMTLTRGREIGIELDKILKL